MAARGAGAAAGADAAHRRAHAAFAADDPEAQARLRGISAGAAGSWAGPTAATCGSTIAGLRAMLDRLPAIRGGTGRAAPDVILAVGTPAVAALLQANAHDPDRVRQVSDPVGAALSRACAAGRQRHRFTARSNSASSGEMAGAAQGDRAARDRVSLSIRDAPHSAIGQFAAQFEAVAPSLGVELTPDRRARRCEIERAVAAFARAPNGGLIVTREHVVGSLHRELIIALAARHRLAGGLSIPRFRRRRRPDVLRT